MLWAAVLTPGKSGALEAERLRSLQERVEVPLFRGTYSTGKLAMTTYRLSIAVASCLALASCENEGVPSAPDTRGPGIGPGNFDAGTTGPDSTATLPPQPPLDAGPEAEPQLTPDAVATGDAASLPDLGAPDAKAEGKPDAKPEPLPIPEFCVYRIAKDMVQSNSPALWDVNGEAEATVVNCTPNPGKFVAKTGVALTPRNSSAVISEMPPVGGPPCTSGAEIPSFGSCHYRAKYAFKCTETAPCYRSVPSCAFGMAFSNGGDVLISIGLP